MDRKDSLSFNISFNLPPEVIREYFDGMAKVEAAKHSGDNNLSLLVQAAVPLLTSHLFSERSKKDTVSVSKEKMLKDFGPMNCPQEESKTFIESGNCSEEGSLNISGFFGSILKGSNGKILDLLKSAGGIEGITNLLEGLSLDPAHKTKLSEVVKLLSNPSVDDSSKEMIVKMALDHILPSGESSNNIAKIIVEEMSNITPTESSVDSKCPIESEEKKSTPKVKPVYNENFDEMNKMMNGNGLVDVMNMFKPMMENMMSGFGNMNVRMEDKPGSETKEEVILSEELDKIN